MKYLIITALALLSILNGCKKGNGGAVETAPSNLVVKSVVSTDGSGSVAFTATADNATTFDYEFGNGEIKLGTTGSINYQYTVAGTNTYSVSVTARNNAGLSVKSTIQVTVTVSSPIPIVFWADEFNTDGAPDPTKWGYDLGTGSGGWGNSELEYYTNRSQNVTVQGGVLKITAIKDSYSGSAYTSTRLLSLNKFAFKYGRVDIRAKLPAGVGTWPAAWMLGTDLATAIWPACGEIDIMEHRGSELNKIFGTLHYPGRSGGNADGSTKVISNATTEFHVYSLDWTAALIRIYVDDQLIHTVVNTSSIPFNHDFFFIINLAMGGTFGGSVDPAFVNATLEVDYIRVIK